MGSDLREEVGYGKPTSRSLSVVDERFGGFGENPGRGIDGAGGIMARAISGLRIQNWATRPMLNAWDGVRTDLWGCE